MASNLAPLPEPAPLQAVTISRDVQDFDLLIEDMETELGEAWGDLNFVEGADFLQQDEARDLEFIVVAVDHEDEDKLPEVSEIIRLAKRAGLQVILVADGLGPTPMHDLMRAGADDFAPYPLPDGALGEAVVRIRQPNPANSMEMLQRAAGGLPDGMAQAGGEAAATTGGGRGANGALFAVQSASGGDGATTMAINLAWELATISKHDAPRVCVIDMGLQFGTVATLLDLPRKPMIYEVLSDVSSMDEQAFRQALSSYKDKLDVFTAPPDILPLDMVGPEDVTTLLTLARSCFDVVIVDMPCAVTGWTDAIYGQSDIYFLVCGLEVRSAQNAMRFQKLLQAEGMSTQQLSFVLNRAPGKMDMSGRARIDKMADGLGVKFHTVLPDGGKQVTEVNDQAGTLSELAPRNAMTKEIQRLAQELHDARQAIESGQTAAMAQKAKKKPVFGLKFG